MNEPSAKDLEDNTGKCVKTDVSEGIYVTCDVKTGITFKVYPNEDCTGEGETSTVGWGDCTSKDGSYVKFTGAMALQAAAVALAAAVGTQF